MNLAAAESATGPFTPAEFFDFAPSARRVEFLDRRMRRELAASLRYIFEEAGELGLPPVEQAALLARIEARPMPPLAFSLYADTVIAVQDGDLTEAARLVASLVQIPAPTGPTKIKALGNPATDPQAQRYVRYIDTDPTFPLEVAAPAPAVVRRCTEIIAAAFALMDAGDPGFAAEIRALLREIILAAGNDDPRVMTFDGVSSFMLWGGIILNTNRSDCPLNMAQMLAHESAHNLMFGFCTEHPLVENEDDELFTSPLRKDPRPMDGIYHATFVTARMHRLVKALLDAGVLNADQETAARKDLADHVRNFKNGIVTVRQHARPTEVGRALIAGAENYMAAQS